MEENQNIKIDNTFKFCEKEFKSIKEDILCSQDELHKTIEENSVGFIVFYLIAVIVVALLFQLSKKDFSNRGKNNK